MNSYILTRTHITAYAKFLKSEEKSDTTIEKYSQTLHAFDLWLAGRAVTKEAVAQWKAYLLEEGKSPATINAKLSAANGLFHYLGWDDCKVRFLKLHENEERNGWRFLWRPYALQESVSLR